MSDIDSETPTDEVEMSGGSAPQADDGPESAAEDAEGAAEDAEGAAEDAEGAAEDAEGAAGDAPGGAEDAVERGAGAAGQPEREDRQLTPEERLEQLDQEADIAADFIEGLLDILDLPGDLEIEVTEEQGLVNVQEVGSGLLIGRRGATLEALQELVRCAVQRSTERRSHIRVDVEGYRTRQLDKLRTKCRDAIAEVRESGQPVRLEPMDAFERKMMHDLVAKSVGVSSSSEGNEPKRRVVIHPAED